ncbi:hypothetical protein LCGC14_2823990, partial [marine sediment metagenome]
MSKKLQYAHTPIYDFAHPLDFSGANQLGIYAR